MAPLVTTPSHPDLVQIDVQSGSFLSSLKSMKAFKKGDRIVTLSKCVFGAEKRYTSVQYAADKHFELNNEFVYMNHSCAPSVQLSVSDSNDIHVFALQDLASGDDLTFFYPSTEWDMDQPFDCTCKADNCLGTIKGAKYLSLAQLEERGFANEHILALKKEQNNSTKMT